MAYMDQQGVIHSADNSLLTLVGRMITDPTGIILVFIPLIILIGIFLIIKLYFSKRILIIYSVISLIIYISYFLLLTRLFIAV